MGLFRLGLGFVWQKFRILSDFKVFVTLLWVYIRLLSSFLERIGRVLLEGWLGVYLYCASWGLLRVEKQKKENSREAERWRSREAKKQKSKEARKRKKAGKKKQRRSRETEMQKACPKRKRKSRKNSRPFNMKEREGFNRYDVYYFLK